jgi:hypothetical protein
VVVENAALSVMSAAKIKIRLGFMIVSLVLIERSAGSFV